MTENYCIDTPPVVRRVSVFRTVKWSPNGKALEWPDRYDGDQTEFTLDMSLWLDDEYDTIAGVDQPISSDPNMVVSAPSVFFGLITTVLSMGDAGPFILTFVVHSTKGFSVEVEVNGCTKGGNSPLGSSLDFSKPSNSAWI